MKSVVAMMAGAAIFIAAGSAQAVLLFDEDVTPDVIFGSGNPNGNFTVNRQGGVELGLRAKLPFVGTTHSNGDGTYSYSLAEVSGNGNRWNFDWSINSDFEGTSGDTVGDFTYVLGIDFDPSSATNFLAFDPTDPNNHPAGFFDHAFGDNATGNGGGSEATSVAEYLAFLDGENVAQNSWRHQFFPIHPTLTFDPTIDGTYDIFLSAFDIQGTAVASTQIQVIIGAGGATVPEPMTMALLGIGLVGVGAARRRAKRA